MDGDQTLPVEVRWKVFGREPLITEVRLANDGKPLPEVGVDVGWYIAATYLALMRADRKIRMPDERPSPGRPATTGFYRVLLADYERLVRNGERTPAVKLAEEHGVKPGTMHQWLFRARKYAQERGRG